VTDRDAPTSGIDRLALAARIDHTLLRPEATVPQVLDEAAVAVSLRCASVCVQPAMVSAVVGAVGDRIPVCSVVGFPHGASLSRTKADEAAAVVALGATEVDVVADLGALADGELRSVAADVAAVREAVPSVVLKVILESALWSPAVLRQVCEVVVDAGADFVKTSTGFHAAGGASTEAVATMRAAVGLRARVKASGGIRDTATALAMVDAGADRLGLSATVAVLGGLDDGAGRA
jgi:deoxyribose-phosphate aldolase